MKPQHTTVEDIDKMINESFKEDDEKKGPSSVHGDVWVDSPSFHVHLHIRDKEEHFTEDMDKAESLVQQIIELFKERSKQERK